MNTIKTLLVILAFPVMGFAQDFTQVMADFRPVNGKLTPNASVYIMKDVSKQWGVSVFPLVTKGWAEFLIGPYWKTKDQSLTLGLQIGLETATPNWRTGASAIYFKNNHIAMMFLEKGAGNENYWYSFQYQNRNHTFLYGARAQRFYGIGPETGIKIGKNQAITLGSLYDFESTEFRPTLFWRWVL